MLTQKTTAAPAGTPVAPAEAAGAAPAEPTPAATAAAATRNLDDLTCYFEGEFVPMRDAKVSIMTHAFMYGTATFEGIRAYWNPEQETLYGVFLREHLERIRKSCRILLMDGVPSVDELVGIILETVRRNAFREDVYIRPSFYKSTRAIGVRLHHLDHELYVITIPFGNYIDTDNGVRIMTSSWRRNADEALPARGKLVGGYVNMAFQKSEAELNGFDEALVLTPDGHASEASAANLFVVRDGVLLTPPVYDDILEGITRSGLLELAAAEGIRTEVRSIDRSELYIADEVFLCGTGVQVSPVVEVDHRKVGTGEVGPISRALKARYFDAVRGRLPEYRHWLTPIDEGG
jgi:branched-chain amino acid aminotransferase